MYTRATVATFSAAQKNLGNLTAVGVDSSNQLINANAKVIGRLVASPYINTTATSLLINGACDLYGWDCTVAAGTITIYDGLNASGTVIVPTTTLTAGLNTFAVGRQLKIGCYVVLSAAATVNVLVNT